MQGKNSIHFKSGHSDWETPQDLFNKLNAEFRFDMDVCASQENTKCHLFLDLNLNALGSISWDSTHYQLVASNDKDTVKRISMRPTFWMNPPYGRGIVQWVDRAYKESKSCTVVCLLPARTDTKWWSIFWDRSKHCPKPGIRVRFLQGRLKFGGSENSAPFPSAIVVMERWKASKLKRKTRRKLGKK